MNDSINLMFSQQSSFREHLLICLCSLFLTCNFLLLSPLQAEQASPELLKSKISEYLSDDEFPTEQIHEVIDDSQCTIEQAATVAAVLVSIKKPRFNQDVFSWALSAEDQNECLRRAGTMELVWDYRRRKKISSIWISNDHLYWRDTGGNEGVPIVADDLAWSGELEKILTQSKSVHKFAWVSGNVSDEAAAELRNRGITLSANRFSKLKKRENIASNIFGLSVASEPEPAPASITQKAEEEPPVPQESEPEEAIDTALEPATEPVEVKNVKETFVEGPDCWEHPKLGRFIFEENDQTTEMTHELPSPAESRVFTLTKVGNQLYWKTNNVEHVFLKESDKTTLFINIHKGNSETELTKCK